MRCSILLAALLLSCSQDVERECEPLTPPDPALPAWFGDPSAPARRIAGTLYEGQRPLAGRVHLRIDAPDPTIWAGVDLDVGPDGKFDFGPQRAGRYRILATATGRVSRLVDVDARTADVADVDVFAWPCRWEATVISTEGGDAVLGASVDLGGVVLGTSDGAGIVRMCITREWMAPAVRAPGFAAASLWVTGQLVQEPVLARSVVLRGRVVDGRGNGVAGVAVQPVYVEQVGISHGSVYGDAPLQVTTDADGNFAVRHVPELDAATTLPDGSETKPARYHVRILRGSDAFVGESDEVVAAARDPVTVTLGCEERPRRKPPEGDATIAGRVLLEGVPLADAIVESMLPYERGPQTRTKRDGSFVLRVPGGRHDLFIRHATGANTARVVEVGEGERRTIELAMGPLRSVDGVVVSPDGVPFAKDVELELAARDGTDRRRATSRDGKFTAELEAGHLYDVTATAYEDGKATAVVDLTGAREVHGLRIVIEPWPSIAGVVVDERGAPVAGARVLATRRVGAATAMLGFTSTLYDQEIATDAAGKLAWPPPSDGSHGLVIVAPDGRIGVAEAIVSAPSPMKITVREPGAIEIACKGELSTMHHVAIVSGARRYSTACGKTEQLPAGAYVVSAKAARGKFTRTEVEVRAGATARAALEIGAPGKIRGVAKSYPGGTPIAGLDCDVGISDGEGSVRGDPGTTSARDGSFELTVSRGPVVVWCGGDDRYARGEATVDLGDEASVVVPVVKLREVGLDLGIGVDTQDGRVRIVKLGAAGALAGLAPGDIVRAVDGISLDGLGAPAARALAFTIDPRKDVSWDVERAGKAQRIVRPAQR